MNKLQKALIEEIKKSDLDTPRFVKEMGEEFEKEYINSFLSFVESTYKSKEVSNTLQYMNEVYFAEYKKELFGLFNGDAKLYSRWANEGLTIDDLRKIRNKR